MNYLLSNLGPMYYIKHKDYFVFYDSKKRFIYNTWFDSEEEAKSILADLRNNVTNIEELAKTLRILEGIVFAPTERMLREEAKDKSNFIKKIGSVYFAIL